MYRLQAKYLDIVMVMKATPTLIFLCLSILAGLAKSEQWDHNIESQVAEDASPGLSSFLEHVLKAQDEINWVKKVFQHEKGSTREQCFQRNSQPFPSPDGFEILDSDSDYHLDTPVQNIEENDWRQRTSGDNFGTDFMYDSSQNRLKSKNKGERFKRKSSDLMYEDPELTEIVRNNINNLHMMKFSPEQDTNIHMIAETSNTDLEDNTSIERRGTGQTDSNKEPSLDYVIQKNDPSDSVIEAYFAAHGMRQAKRRQSISTAHSRGVRVDIPDLLNEADLLKTMNERSEQEHQRLQLEDADGLLKGTRVETHIGSTDNQMTLDKEKTMKQSNKAKLQTVPIKESKITSRDSQSQERGLPQQIKLDLLNDPLYNKVDLKSATRNVNVRNDKGEKSLIGPLGAGHSALDSHLLSSVNQYLAGFDQQRPGSANRDEPELGRSQIFLNKKDTIGQQVKWDESAVKLQPLEPAQVKPLPNIAEKDSDLYAKLEADLNVASKDLRPLRLTRSNHDISGDSSQPASELSTSKIRNQLMGNDQGLLQSSRGKRTVVKRPGAIWHESNGNEDLEEEANSENEDKEIISFESEESDVDGKISRNGNGCPSKSTSDDDHSSLNDGEEIIEEVNDDQSDKKHCETDNESLDQKYGSDNGHLDDAEPLKASLEFSSKYVPVLETHMIQKADDKKSDCNDSPLVRNERSIKKTRQGVITGKSSKQEEKVDGVGVTSNGGSYHERKTENNHLDDASRLKASFKFSSKFIPPLDTSKGQESEDIRKAFDFENSRPMRGGQDTKKSFRCTETLAGGKDRSKFELKSREAEPKVSSDDVLQDSNVSNMQRKRRENNLLKGKSYASRSLLSLFEPTNIIHNLENDEELFPPSQNIFPSKREEREEEKYLAEPLSEIIDRELRTGNLPPLVRVKRSATDVEVVRTYDKNCNKLDPEIVVAKQSALDEKPAEHHAEDWESSLVSEKRSAFDKELNMQGTLNQDSVHSNAKRPVAMPSDSNMAIRKVNMNRALNDVHLDEQDSCDQKSVYEKKRQSADDKNFDKELTDNTDVDPEAIFENLWSSGSARVKRAHVHSKRNHGRGKGPTARDAGGKEWSGGKGTEKFSRDMKSEWKINIRSPKHTYRNIEDEDEKEYESADLNMFTGNVTKRASEQSDSRETNFGDDDGSSIDGLVDETEDENEYESSEVEKGKDYDVVRRHVQHCFHKRHPSNKNVEQASISNIGDRGSNDESKIEDDPIKLVVKYEEREEEKERRPNAILSEDRFKRASNYAGVDSGKVKSDVLNMPGLKNDMDNIKLIRNSQSQIRSDFKSQYENANKLQDHPVDLNPSVITNSNMMNQHTHDSPNVNIKLPGSSNEKAVQDSVSPGSDLHEIHEMHLAGAKLSDSSAYGIDPKTSVPFSNDNYENMKLLVPVANEQAPELHVRCAEKCNASPACLDAGGVSSASQSCSTKCPGPDSQQRAERRVDRRRGVVATPKPGKSEVSASSEYKGELDDGQLATEIVQAILQQVDKTPCLKKSFGSGLSLRYHPSEIKETKENNSHSQQMMHQIMQLIDQSVDEEVKSRTCSSLPSDLEEFIMWLMKNETHPVSSAENPFIVESHCEKAPAPRHLEEPKAEDIERQISLRNKLIGEYNTLDKCEQDQVKPIYNYLSEQKSFLSSLLQKSKSKPGCNKRTEGSKKPEEDTDFEQQRLVEETMDSVGLGPNAMHSSNIGDKFISGLSMVDESAEQMSDSDFAMSKNGQMGSRNSLYGQSYFPNTRSEYVYSHRIQRDAEDELLPERYPQNSRLSRDGEGYDDVMSDDDYEADENNDEVSDNYDLKRSLKYLNRHKDNGNKRRSIKESYFFPSRKYQRLVALASDLERKKRNTLRRKKQMVK